MHCSHCGHDNKDEAKFCNECGVKLELACPTCATVNAPKSKFCNECGEPLARQSQVTGRKSQVANSQHLILNPQPPVAYTPNG